MAPPKPIKTAQPPTRPRPSQSGDAKLEIRFLQSVFAEISGSGHLASKATTRGAAKDGEPRH